MEITTLDQQVSVSGQITVEDVAALKAMDVQLIVCNRPDKEAEDQPDFATIEAAAQAAGLDIMNIPFSGGAMLPEQAEAFAELLATGKRLHAYCRTGNRSSQIWTAAKHVA